MWPTDLMKLGIRATLSRLSLSISDLGHNSAGAHDEIFVDCISSSLSERLLYKSAVDFSIHLIIGEAIRV